MTYRDGKGGTLVQLDYEFTDGNSTQRVTGRTLLWGADGTQRTVVRLNNGRYLFFPQPLETEEGCPPEIVIKDYLHGETVDGRRRPSQSFSKMREESYKATSADSS
ncbi:MAG: hypothetical protein HY892_02835 [Deltaproteobacteria bacterium]|nr:hypothetical protein [Deltaproteobacteria bacterium]